MAHARCMLNKHGYRHARTQKYVILFVFFHGNSERASVLRHTHVASLVAETICVVDGPNQQKSLFTSSYFPLVLH